MEKQVRPVDIASVEAVEAMEADGKAKRGTGVEQLTFGVQRILDPNRSLPERLLFRFMGVGDPAHYLHWRYLQGAINALPGFLPCRVLDAGCGRGDYSIYLAQRYPQATVLGIDVNADLIARNRQTASSLGLSNLRFEVADLAQARFTDAFDLVICIDVLEHIQSQAQALANLCESLSIGGVAFFHIPTTRERPVPFDRWLGDSHAWAAREHVGPERTASELIDGVRRHLEVVTARRTFGYFTGEMATSLFGLPYSNTPLNRFWQGVLAPLCRLLALADGCEIGQARYAVAILARRRDLPSS